MFLIWGAMAIKDRVPHKHRFASKAFFKNKHEAKCNNFAVRVFYEFFFEFCICLLINMPLTKFISFSYGSQWLISIIMLIGIIVFCGWIISLFYKNGPFLEGFYNKGTFISSLMSARPFDTNFNAVTHLENLRKEKESQNKKAVLLERKNTAKLLGR